MEASWGGYVHDRSAKRCVNVMRGMRKGGIYDRRRLPLEPAVLGDEFPPLVEGDVFVEGVEFPPLVLGEESTGDEFDPASDGLPPPDDCVVLGEELAPASDGLPPPDDCVVLGEELAPASDGLPPPDDCVVLGEELAPASDGLPPPDDCVVLGEELAPASDGEVEVVMVVDDGVAPLVLVVPGLVLTGVLLDPIESGVVVMLPLLTPLFPSAVMVLVLTAGVVLVRGEVPPPLAPVVPVVPVVWVCGDVTVLPVVCHVLVDEAPAVFPVPVVATVAVEMGVVISGPKLLEASRVMIRINSLIVMLLEVPNCWLMALGREAAGRGTALVCRGLRVFLRIAPAFALWIPLLILLEFL